MTYLTGQRHGGPPVYSVVDPAQGKLGRQMEGWIDAIAPGGRLGIRFDTNRDRAYLTVLATGRVEPSIRTGPGPTAVAFSPAGTIGYIADSGTVAYEGAGAGGDLPGNRSSDLVTVINLRTDRSAGAIRTCPGPRGLAVSAPTHRLVVVCSTTIALVDTDTDRRVSLLHVGGYERGIVAVSPSGTEAVVGDTQIGNGPIPGGSIVPIDLRTATASPPITIGTNDEYTGGTAALVFDPANISRVYVTTYRQSTGTPVVVAADLTTGTVSAPLRLGDDIVGAITVWPNGQTGFVAQNPRQRSGPLRVGLSLGGPTRLSGADALRYGSTFASQVPYFVTLSRNQRTIDIVDVATGATVAIHTSFFTDSLLSSTPGAR